MSATDATCVVHRRLYMQPGAAATSAAARPVLGDIVEHVYEAATPQQENITTPTTTTSTSCVTAAHASAASSPDVAGPVRVKELRATLKPIQAVVGQAFPPVRPHTSYRVPTTTTTTMMSCTRDDAQAACACPATMQHTDNNTNKSDTPLTRDGTSITTSAAVPSCHSHNNDTNATRPHSDTQPSATSTPSVLLPPPSSQRGVQVSAHVQPDMPSLEDSADPATTLRFTRPSYAQSTHITTTTTTSNNNVVQPVSHSAGTYTSAETMPELLGRLPVGGIAMRTTTTTSNGDIPVAAEAVAVPCQWSPMDFVHMFRGYYAVPVREDVLIQQQQEEVGGMMSGYDMRLDLQAWSQTHNNTDTSSSSSSERTAITTSTAVSSQPHQATTTTAAVVPTGEAYLRLLRRGLCSTVTRHQTLAMQALLLHLHYEGAVLRERCLRGTNSNGFTSLSEGETSRSDDDSGVSLLQTLLTHMTQATQVMPCRLAARCLLALLSPTATRFTQDEPTHHATPHSTSSSPSTTTSHSPTTTTNNYNRTTSLVMQPREILQYALREIAFPLTDPTGTHTTRRPNEENKGTHTNTTSKEEEDDTCTGPQLPSTQEELERLLSSGDDADVALAAEALGLTEKLLRVMPLLLLIQPAEDTAWHETHADTHTASTKVMSSTPLTSAGRVAEEEEKGKSDARCKKTNNEPSDTYYQSHRYATETLFLQLLRCGGLGLSEQTSCMRVAHNALFAQWAEQQLSEVVLGERDLASLLPLLCVLHDIAHCPKAFTALLTTMSFDANSAANALLTGSNKNKKKKVLGSGNSRSSEGGKESEGLVSHGTARETWLLFALYICSMDVTRHTNTSNTNSSNSNNAGKTSEKKDNDSELATTTAVVMSLLLLRELIRHGIGLTLFLRDTCSTILETGMTMGAAMLLEMWLVLLEQQQQQTSNEEESKRNNTTTITTATVTSSPLSVRPEQPIFDEAARIAWHLYRHSLTTITNTTAVVDANTSKKNMAGRAHMTRTEEEEEGTSTSQSTHNMPALLREVAAVTNGHFLATYLTLRATHHEHKAPNTYTDCAYNNSKSNEEDSHAVSHSSSLLQSFFGSVAETRRQVLALLTDLVANEGAHTVPCEPQAAVMIAPVCTAPHSDITASSNTFIGNETEAHTQASPDMTCGQTAQQTHEQHKEGDCVHEACSMARRYANARVACAIHTAWASLLPDTEPLLLLLLLHHYGNAGLTAFVQHCLDIQSESAVRHVLQKLQPEELSTVLELIDLVQHTTTPQSTQTTTTEDEENETVEKELMDMAALLVLQGMCVTGHCLDGAPRALRCLLQHTHITTNTTTTSLTPTPHSSQSALSLSSPSVSHASLVACLCAGLERAAGLRVATDTTTQNTDNSNGGRDGDEGERGDARTTLIGGGAEGRPWLLYPLYYNNNNSESDEEAEEDETVEKVDRVVWAHWLIGLTRLPSWFTQHVLQCDMLLSHTLLWTLAHRGSLFAQSVQRTTTTTQAYTEACPTTTTTSEDESEGREMTEAEVRALCALLAELALLLVPAEVVVAEGDDNSSITVTAVGQKSLTTTTTTVLDTQPATSLPSTQQPATHLTQPRYRFSPSASATLGIPLQAYAHPQSEAPMPAVLHCVLALVAAYAQPTTTLAALQLLLNTPLCTITTTTTQTAAETMGTSESARCHTKEEEGRVACDDDAKKKTQERHDELDCVEDNNNDDNNAAVCHSLSRLQAQLRAALTWWSSAVQPPLPHSVNAIKHETTCSAQSNTFTSSTNSSVLGVRWSLTELVALLQLVGPHLTRHLYRDSNTRDATYTYSNDDYEGDDVVSDTETGVCETDVHHNTTPTYANAASEPSREKCEDDIRRWCVETVTEGLMRRYLYTHAKSHISNTTTTTTMSDTCKTEASVGLSAMEQTVLRETLWQLHWQPAALWPYVA